MFLKFLKFLSPTLSLHDGQGPFVPLSEQFFQSLQLWMVTKIIHSPTSAKQNPPSKCVLHTTSTSQGIGTKLAQQAVSPSRASRLSWEHLVII